MLKSAGLRMISSTTFSFILINQLRIFQIELLLIFHKTGRIFDFVTMCTSLQVYILYGIHTSNGCERS